MKLEIGKFMVKDIVFGDKTAYANGVLTVDKDDALACVREDKHITDADLRIVHPGDMVRLYEVTASEECPVCQSNLPPFSYCPSCGIPWSDSGKSVETLLSSMRQEAARNIRDPKASGASRLAWYWSHIGAIDLARQMGVITEDRRQALYEEMRPLKPTDTDGTMNGGVV